MAGALDADGAKVHRQHVKRRLGAALHRGGDQGGKAVHALGLHGFNQHGTCRAARKRLDQRRWQCIDKARVHARPFNTPADGVQHIAQRARRPKHAHRAQHGDQVRQQAFGDVKAFFATFDKGLVHRHAPPCADADKQQHQAKQRQIAQQRRQLRQRGSAQGGEQRHKTDQQQRHRQQIGQHHRAENRQPLHRRHAQQPDQRRGRSGQQNRQKHQRRVRRALLQAVHEDGDRQQRQRRGVEHQKQNLRVAGTFGRGIERLQRAHGFEAHRCGGVVQPQRVGGKVQRHQPQRRVAARHAGHQLGKQRRQPARQRIDNAGALGNAQKAQPQRQRAKQQHHHLHRQPRHGKQRLDHRRKHLRLAADEPLRQRGNGGAQEKSQPEGVEHRKAVGE